MDLVERMTPALQVRSVVAPRNWILHEDIGEETVMVRFVSLSCSSEILTIIESRCDSAPVSVSLKNSLSGCFQAAGLTVTVLLCHVDPEEYADDFRALFSELRDRYVRIQQQELSVLVSSAACSVSVRISGQNIFKLQHIESENQRLVKALRTIVDDFEIVIRLQAGNDWYCICSASSVRRGLLSHVDNILSSAVLGDDMGDFARAAVVAPRLGSTRQCVVVSNIERESKFQVIYPIPSSIAGRMRSDRAKYTLSAALGDTIFILPATTKRIELGAENFAVHIQEGVVRCSTEASCRSVEEWVQFHHQQSLLMQGTEARTLRPNMICASLGNSVVVTGFMKSMPDRVVRAWARSASDEEASRLVRIILESVVRI